MASKGLWVLSDYIKAQLAAVVPLKFKPDWLLNPVLKTLIVDHLEHVVEEEYEIAERQQGRTANISWITAG